MFNPFKSRPKKVVTTNKLCVQLTETAMFELAEELYSTYHKKSALIMRKKTYDECADLFDTLLESFGEEISLRFPWILHWKLIEKRLTNTQSDYYIEVIEHTLDNSLVVSI